MTSREFQDRLTRRATRADLNLPTALAEKLEAYLRLLARWNQKINLTALPVLEPNDETIDRLLIEPLVAGKRLGRRERHVIDLGSGGGSPAIPLKLAHPDLSLRMVESKTRKAAFLNEAIRTLALAAVVVYAARYEELLTQPALHEAADIATVRALRLDQRAYQTIQAFVKPGGRLFLFQGLSSESPAVLPPSLVWRGSFSLAGSGQSRLVILEKSSVPHVPRGTQDPR